MGGARNRRQVSQGCSQDPVCPEALGLQLQVRQTLRRCF